MSLSSYSSSGYSSGTVLVDKLHSDEAMALATAWQTSLVENVGYLLYYFTLIVGRLEQFKTQHELARNFYDDVEFCPLSSFDEVAAHRNRIQQRSPYSSPRSSPPVSYNSTASPPKRKAIPIINPENMTPVAVGQQHQQPYGHHQQQQHPHYHHQQQQDYFPTAQWQSYTQERPSSSSSSSGSSLSSSASMFSPSSMIQNHVIPIINPSTGQALLHHPMYDVTVR
ncbi:hypothetical protein [Absidia glauca]|uniref:Uncharacterized protein n=1 Tax=Absidia glauca TaxID=4829 RepID=A0A168SC19_ABSGL|nr:hypothetical protein [Absidia glauca]